ncbi:MAG: low molecular weight phosphotyrosine protein phosphatase [Bacteroidetes bacterium]|nr:low molecular weight phosphotyrosine protein phosphatase [Bacteroidota bacterium]
MNVLMVCLGNICRSPLAEGIMREKLNKHRIQAVVDSAGMIDFHEGSLPDHRSIATARNHGVDISKQRSRPFKKADIVKFDYIFAMDNNNYESLIEFADTRDQEEKIHLLMEFAGFGVRRSVPDPYYGNLSDFENVFKCSTRHVNRLHRKLQSNKAK